METTVSSAPPPAETSLVSQPLANPPDSGNTAPPPLPIQKPPPPALLTNWTSPPPTPEVSPPPPTQPITPPTAPLPSDPPQSAPPPPPSDPPKTSPPPPVTSPPPPPPVDPPKISPPTPPAEPPAKSLPAPANSPPPPKATPPSDAPPPPPHITPPAPPNSPPSPPPPSSPPPSPVIDFSPPPSVIPPPVSPFSPPPPPPPPNGNKGTNLGLMIGVPLAAACLVIIALALFWFRKRRTKPAGVSNMPSYRASSPEAELSFLKVHSSESDSPSEELLGSTALFAYEELTIATDGFAPGNLLGEGGFGSVYKGFMADGKVVAVKQLKAGSGQGEREFKAEVEIISRIHHRHLVSLVGYCISDSQRLLVYDYVPNNTLDFHLHGSNQPAMNWETRMKVIAGAARGIAYLHQDSFPEKECLVIFSHLTGRPRVIHRDIKTSNILLDENFEARVSDFGLARFALDTNTHVTTRVMGTFGYLAPEYASSGELTEKSDVYSFGVVLLEMITGRKPVDSSKPVEEASLVERARPIITQASDEDKCETLVDPRLGGSYSSSEMLLVMEAASACVRHSAAKRPSMGQIVRAFDSMTVTDLSNGLKVGQSQIVDSDEEAKRLEMWRMAFSTNFSFSVEASRYSSDSQD